MVGMVMLAVIVMGVGWIIWLRRRRARAYIAPVPLGGASHDLALDAFAHGNSYLAEGKFTEAIAAFHQALALEPKHPHVAGRLAEVERRQQAASATPPVNATA
jgi:tetratricopeptide (TPR) repeat protein